MTIPPFSKGKTSTPDASGERQPVFCPECGHRYEVAPTVLKDPHLKVLCGTCNSIFVPTAIPPPKPRPPVVEGMESALRPVVVVAHESPAVCTTVGRVLEDSGFTVRFVHDGGRAIAAFDEALPDQPVALVMDVGLPGVLAFEVCSVLKSRPRAQHVRVVMLASVFERTRYKRRPTSLHGADGYVELHHVPDRLVPMLKELLAGERVVAGHPQALLERARADALRAETTDLAAARVLARRLVSDVALYHEAELAAALSSDGSVQNAVVREAFAEARGIFMRRVGNAAGAGGLELFEEAVHELLVGLARGRRPGAGS